MKFHDVVECIELDQHYQEKLHLEGEHPIFLSSQYQEDIDAMSREKWELLYDPTPSRALKRTRQQASIVAQQVLAKSQVSAVCLLDQKAETTGYTVSLRCNNQEDGQVRKKISKGYDDMCPRYRRIIE